MKLYRLITIPLLALFVVFGLGAQSSAFAQVASTPSYTAPASSGPMIPACYPFSTDIHYGSYDSNTSDGITALQNFLVNQGLFTSASVGTGHFGPLTLSAVKEFQAKEGLPTTGFVGPLTRAIINKVGCGLPTQPIVTPSTNPAVLDYLSPTSAGVGSTVTITGTGFTGTNTILMDGNVAAQNVSINSTLYIPCASNVACNQNPEQTLKFTVPSSLAPYCAPGMACPMYMRLTTAGQYTITVLNTNGTSNALPLTVTSGTSIPNPNLSISGIDAPSSLAMGQTGSWTVHAISSNSSGNLHYSVSWGDGLATANSANAIAEQTYPVQNSATFSHAYQSPGTYTATFTVSDDAGNTTSASNTLTISPIYY